MLDAELAEDVGEVTLDGPVGEEERCGHLAVRLAFGDERGDALLRGREGTRRRGPPADARKLTPSALGPEGSADSLEHCKRLLERLPSLTPPLRASLCGAEGEKGAATVERDFHLRMPVERVLVGGKRGVELTPGGGQQTATARARCERRDALEPLRVALVPVEQLDGVLPASQLDQSLDVVDDEPGRPRLD